MDNDNRTLAEQAPVKRTVGHCDKCRRVCLFFDDKCQGCFLRLVKAINEDAKLLES